jgi:predicted exporter
LLLLALGVGVISRPALADLSAFMPRLPTQRQQLLLDQLQDGIVARLIMVGIEGSDAPTRARLPRELAPAAGRPGLSRRCRTAMPSCRSATGPSSSATATC